MPDKSRKTSVRRHTSNPNDLRVKKSIREIKRALLAMIEKKPYKEIKVGDVTSEALINRETFYRHFASLDDVMGSIREDILQELSSQLTDKNNADFQTGISILYNYINGAGGNQKAAFS